ncbi:hypothetical protein ABW20_dc0106861 [Dactylellina cionopaga]|nr:hypothetical protein ABW20_dc0106861 [Dactylellina cionopaga]
MVQAGATYFIRNKETDTVLDLNEDNGWVRAWNHKGGDNQKWVLEREGPGHPWTLRNLASGQFLALEGGEPGHATKHSEEPQLWHIRADEDGFRLVTAENHELHIDVENSSHDNDTKVLIWTPGGNNQLN